MRMTSARLSGETAVRNDVEWYVGLAAAAWAGRDGTVFGGSGLRKFMRGVPTTVLDVDVELSPLLWA